MELHTQHPRALGVHGLTSSPTNINEETMTQFSVPNTITSLISFVFGLSSHLHPLANSESLLVAPSAAGLARHCHYKRTLVSLAR